MEIILNKSDNLACLPEQPCYESNNRIKVLCENYTNKIYFNRINNITASKNADHIFPLEIWKQIADYLNFGDIVKLSMVSRDLYFYMTSDIIIKNRIQNIIKFISLNVFCDEYQCYLMLKPYFDKIQTENCYHGLSYWLSILNIVSYCRKPNTLISFTLLIKSLHINDHLKIKKNMRNAVWFTLNKTKRSDLNWLIKTNFKITDDMTQLILSIKICVVSFCPVDNFCIKKYHDIKMSECNRYYRFATTDEFLCNDLILPKNQLTNQIFKRNKETNKEYKSLHIRFDIKNLKKIQHWALLYEFIIKILCYEPNSEAQVPKIYYGEFKNIKNSNVKELYWELNLVAKLLSRILNRFKNYGGYMRLDKKELRKCNQQFKHEYEYEHSDDEIDFCYYCGNPGSMCWSCEKFA